MSDNPQAGPLSLADAVSQIAALDEPVIDEPTTAEDQPDEADNQTPAAEAQTEEVEDDPQPEPEADEAEEEDGDEDNVEADADESEGDDEEETFLVTLTINGEKVQREVSGSELVNGYQRLEDYRLKTAALSEERKAFDAERQAIEAEKAQYAQGLQQLQAMLAQAQPQEPDWQDLAENDPLEYARQRAQWDQYQRQLQAVTAENERMQQQRMQEFLAVEGRKLTQRIPEWTDGERAAREKQEVARFLQAAGYTPQELQFADARALELARKAWLYDQQQKAKPTVLKKVKKAPKLVRAGTPATKQQVQKSQRDRQMKRLEQTGKLEDALPLLMRI